MSRSTPAVYLFRFIALSTGLALGCLTGELRSMDSARAEYEACVSEYSAEDPECERLHARLLDAQRRYEQNSRGAWTCDPMSEDCPTRR